MLMQLIPHQQGGDHSRYSRLVQMILQHSVAIAHLLIWEQKLGIVLSKRSPEGNMVYK